MSLITKMLADLKKPSSPETQSQQKAVLSLYANSSRFQLKYVVYGIGGLLLLVLLIILGYYSWKSMQQHLSKIKPPVVLTQTIPSVATANVTNASANLSAVAPPTAPLPAVTLPPVSPITLDNIALNTADGKTMVNFLISARATYHLDRSIDQKELTITLDNTTIKNNNALNTVENSPIQALTTTQINTTAQIVLKLLPDTQVESLEYSEQPQSKLVLVLTNAQLSAPKITKVAIPVSPDIEAQKQYQDILDLAAHNQIQTAIERLYLLLGDFPNHVAARELLAQLLIKVNKLSQAQQVLDIGLKKYPGYAAFVKLKAYTYSASGNNAAALKLLENNQPADMSEDPEYFAFLANLYQQQKRYLAAAQIYYQLTKIQPDNGVIWLGLGTALDAANKHNAALEAYQKSIDAGNLPVELHDFVITKLKR